MNQDNPVFEAASLPGAENEKIDCWAYVEIFGHHQLAGRVTTRKLGVQVMLQVDVPKGDAGFCHTELYSPNSIFSIKPTTEDWCRKWAGSRADISSILPYVPFEDRPLLNDPDNNRLQNSD